MLRTQPQPSLERVRSSLEELEEQTRKLLRALMARRQEPRAALLQMQATQIAVEDIQESVLHRGDTSHARQALAAALKRPRQRARRRHVRLRSGAATALA